MIETFYPTAEFINSVINAPGVRPTVQAGTDRLDAARFVREPRNAVLAYRGGVAAFEHVERGLYEGHVFCLPGQRGSQALEFGRRAVTWLFETVGADKLWVPVAIWLPAARFYCRKLGLRYAARDLFQEYFEMEAVQWAA